MANFSLTEASERLQSVFHVLIRSHLYLYATRSVAGQILLESWFVIEKKSKARIPVSFQCLISPEGLDLLFLWEGYFCALHSVVFRKVRPEN